MTFDGYNKFPVTAIDELLGTSSIHPHLFGEKQFGSSEPTLPTKETEAQLAGKEGPWRGLSGGAVCFGRGGADVAFKTGTLCLDACLL